MRGPAERSRAGWLTLPGSWPLAIAAWLAIRVTGFVLLGHGYPSVDGDVTEYHRWAFFLYHGLLPWHSFFVEYPPGVLPVMLLPGGQATYTHEIVLLAMAADALLAYWLWRENRGGLAVWLWILLPVLLGPVEWVRLDVFVALAIYGFVRYMERSRWWLAGVCLAAATLIKLWPLVLLAMVWPLVDRTACRRIAAATGATLICAVVPVLAWGGAHGLRDMLSFQSNRGLESESLWAYPAQVIHRSASSLHLGHGGLELVLSGPAAVADSLLLVVALLLAAGFCWWDRGRRLSLRNAVLLGVAVVLATSKALSPQYLVWAVLVVALAVAGEDRWPARERYVLVGTTAALAITTQWLYPFTYFHTYPTVRTDALVSLSAHAALVVVWLAVVLRYVLRRPPREESAAAGPVRSGLLDYVLYMRYPLMIASAGMLAAILVAKAGPHPFNDWLEFEAGARIIVHLHHDPAFGGGALGLYARIPGIQIGPPAILPVAAVQWLTPYTVNKMFVVVMLLLGVAAVAAAEATARSGARPTARRVVMPAAAVGGVLVLLDWAWCIVHWHHLDDVMALSLTAIACLLIARRRPWWLVGLLLGTAVAAKPWAIILTPVLLGMDREARSKAILVVLGVAAAWWAPFVIGDSGTIAALGGYHVPVQNGSVLRLLGIRGDVHDWLRPVQFIGGAALGVLVARRGGRWWLAAPLAALAFRVLTDPFDWGYYGMGPMLFALMWDLSRPGARRLPLYLLFTAPIEGLLPRLVSIPLYGPVSTSADVAAALKLVWALVILAALAWEWSRARPQRSSPDESLAGDIAVAVAD